MILSGLVLAYPYKETLPLVSTVGIENLVPFGRLFRRLHYLTGLLTLVFLLYHAFEAWRAQSYERRSWLRWLGLGLTLPWMFLLAFTGYIARGDQTGLFAGYIAETLSLHVPFLGPYVNAFFFLVREEGVHRAYWFHLYGSGLMLLTVGLWHFRLRRTPLNHLLYWGTFSLALVPFLPLGLHGPGNYLLVKGPWFFVGIQEALRYLPPTWAGVIFPLLGPALYIGIKASSGRTVFKVAFLLWLGTYGGLTIVGLAR